MDIPIPCKFGEKALCNGKELFLSGVSWFKSQMCQSKTESLTN